MTQAHESDDDDDVPVLTGATAAALREFLAEAEAAKAKAAARGDDGDDVESLFTEDWGLSQFWYTDSTAEAVAAAVIKAAQERAELACCDGAGGGAGAGGGGAAGAAAPAAAASARRRRPRIACVACPSLFRALRASPEVLEAADAHLFEFDDRFAKLGGGFSHYDYRRPREVSPELARAFDAVVADPPYLSAECLKKTAVTMRLLGAGGGEGGGAVGERVEAKEEGEAAAGGGGSGASGGAGNEEEERAPSSSSTLPPPPPVFVLLSGAVQRHRAAASLGLLPVAWRPQHRNKLGNEFLLMTSSAAVAAELGGFDEELPIDAVEDGGRSDSDSDDGDEGHEDGEEEELAA